jgi:nitroimidazol reductase NimA-like FMN-containing flavoprotein (pyridoxamine 5'-phosphate oxidase superfamily)
MTHGDERRAGSIKELSETECWALLDTTTVGRVAFVSAEGQQLLPVNFVVIDEKIYFRTLPGGVLDSALSRGHDDVAFGVDHHEDMYRHGWNVTVRGGAVGVEDRATINMVLSTERLRPWAGGVRPAVIRVTPRSIAGRKVCGH